MRANADQIDYSVQGGALLTGEYFYGTVTESSIVRVVVLELQKGDVNLELLTHCQDAPWILETLLYRILYFVIRNWDECLTLISDTVNLARRSMQAEFSNPRFAEYAGQYAAAAEILCRMLQSECGVPADRIETLRREMHDNVLLTLRRNDLRMQEQAPIMQLLRSIQFAMESGATIPWGTPLPKEACVIIGEDAVYFQQRDLPDLMKAYCEKHSIPYVKRSSQALGDILRNAEICCATGSENRISRRYKRVYGDTRLIALPKPILEELPNT